MQTHHPTSLIYIRSKDQEYKTTVRFNNFADGDAHCLIEDTSHIIGADVIVRHNLYPNQNEWIVRLLFLVNTLNDLGANSVEVFVPYLPYARQDKSHMPGEAISSSILCRLLLNSGCTTLYTIDCHFMKGKPLTTVEGLKIHNYLIQDSLINELRQETGDKPIRIIGPDAGSAYLAGGETMIKARSAHYEEAPDGSIKRDVEILDGTHITIDNDDCLVIADDMVSTGSTMIKALESLKQRGIKNLYVITTHGLFLHESFEKISKLTKRVVYSDTIPRQNSTPVVDDVFDEIVSSLK